MDPSQDTVLWETDDAISRLRAVTVRLAQALRAPATQHGLTPSRLSALVLLSDHSPIRLGDFAREFGVTPASASRLIDVLAELGMVRRVQDPTDQRACLLTVTEQGTKALAEVRRDGREQLGHHVDALPDDQRLDLLAAIPALERLAESMIPADSGQTAASPRTSRRREAVQVRD